MKDIKPKLIELFKEGYCTPQIARIAKKLKQPSTTIHYNIKSLEKEQAIRTYKAVFDYNKVELGFCGFVLIKLAPETYSAPEIIANKIAGYKEIESVDLVTGDFEIVAKLRARDKDHYFELIKSISSIQGVIKAFSLISLKQIKTEFVEL